MVNVEEEEVEEKVSKIWFIVYAEWLLLLQCMYFSSLLSGLLFVGRRCKSFSAALYIHTVHKMPYMFWCLVRFRCCFSTLYVYEWCVYVCGSGKKILFFIALSSFRVKITLYLSESKILYSQICANYSIHNLITNRLDWVPLKQKETERKIDTRLEMRLKSAHTQKKNQPVKRSEVILIIPFEFGLLMRFIVGWILDAKVFRCNNNSVRRNARRRKTK